MGKGERWHGMMMKGLVYERAFGLVDLEQWGGKPGKGKKTRGRGYLLPI